MSKNTQAEIKKYLGMGFGFAVGSVIFVPLLGKVMSMLNVRI